VQTDGRISYTYQVPANVLPPFSNITYRFQVSLKDGQAIDSSEFNFRYEDNRFAWSMLENDALRIFWYEGDTEFGQDALDAALAGLAANSETFQLYPNSTIDIYVYASSNELLSALGPGSPFWAAGHTSPELGAILVSIPPGAEHKLEMERQIPHELAHILLYQNLGKAIYIRMPTWMREGMPSMVETYPNADYERSLRLAAQNQTLIPLTDLCTVFPLDAQGAFLAYAESDSFTRHLYTNGGASNLLALARAYGDGLGCSQGLERTYNKSLDVLESEWQATQLGVSQTFLPTLLETLPYIGLPMLILLPMVLIMVMGAGQKQK